MINPNRSPSITFSVSNRKIDEYSDNLKSLIQEAFTDADIIDLADLCITPHKKCWIVHIDVLILECDGNLLDTISIATHSALTNTKFDFLLLLSLPITIDIRRVAESRR